MTDLYDTLGVGHDATPEDIQRAYRHKAKQHHPDAGGKAEAFHAIVAAHKVLSDPDKRQRYDQTGEAEDKPEVSPDVPAINILQQVVRDIMNSDAEDVLAGVRDVLTSTIGAIDGEIAKLEARAKKLVKQKARLKRTKKANGTFSTILDTFARDIGTTIANANLKKSHLTRALEMLDGYSMTPDPDKPPAPFGWPKDELLNQYQQQRPQFSNFFGNTTNTRFPR